MTKRKRPPYHVAEYRKEGWSLEHEEKCFQAGSLLDCPVHIEMSTWPNFNHRGRFRVDARGDGYALGEREPSADA